MIQEATGKFSSRWVLPDRRSLAVVIQDWLHLLNIAIPRNTLEQRYAGSLADPHIWEIRRRNQDYLRNFGAGCTQQSGLNPRDLLALLSVIGQHLAAGSSQLRAVLLQASQNG